MADARATLERVRSYVECHRASLHTPGLALALTDRDHPLGAVTDGFANVDARTPVRAGDRFQIGSISKGFGAMALLQEREAGRLDLDAPVTEYLPWFEVHSSFPPITVHHLLSHTSGIVCGTDSTGEAAHEVWRLRETHAGFAPGERFLYSNVGYKALGLVLARIAGRPWWEVVRERVMAPIGMREVDVVITSDSRARLAVGHASPFGDRPWQPRHGWAPSPWFDSATADGTICATAEELTAYVRLLLNGGRGVLEAGSFALMARPVIEEPAASGSGYGYGLKKMVEPDGRRLLGHSGGMVGYTAYALAEPESGFGVTVLMNSPFGLRLELARFALACLRAEAAGLALPEIPEPADPEVVQDAGSYAGTFVDERGAVTVLAEGAGLALEDDGRRSPLVPVDADRFLVDDPERDRYPFDVLREDGVVTQAFWGPRWLRQERYSGPASFEHPAGWTAFTGRYRTWNPWAVGFEVTLRRGRLWLGFPVDALDWGEREMELVPLGDGSFRVGEAWSPDRVSFDTVIDGKATRAVLDAAAFYRNDGP